MPNHERSLLVGPLLVVLVIASAQCGAYALNTWPQSALLWYLNLEVFRPVQYSFFIGANLDPSGLSQAFAVMTALLALICTGSVGKTRLPLAIASNLSFLYSVVLFYGFYVANNRAFAIGIDLNMLWAPSFALVLVVLVAAVVSSVSAHRAYWREIFPLTNGAYRTLRAPAK
jgi:hypothetical protein